jgi:hypothetical protein
MTNASRFPVIRFLLLGVLVLAATSWAQKGPPISEEIAKTYGLSSRAVGIVHLLLPLPVPGIKGSFSTLSIVRGREAAR